MFERFLKAFPLTSYPKKEVKKPLVLPNSLKQSTGAVEFFSNFEGSTFSNGLYRVHSIVGIEKWTRIVEDSFPTFKNIIKCFGYDWNGRQFALDFSRVLNNEPVVLMFDIAIGKVFKIPASFHEFHNCELVDYPNDIFELDLFNEWSFLTKSKIFYHQCVGYKLPLFLNSENDIENLEITDMEVYWHLFGTLLKQFRKLPPGFKISTIKIR